jgi:P27 family predicted phage terminase small subunit
MRGRKPLPAAIRALHGRPHRATKAKQVPITRAAPAVRDRADELPPPGWLSPWQATAWIDAVRDAPWLGPLDTVLLGAWVCACDFHRQASEVLHEQGMTVTDATGREHVHPAVRVISQQAAVIMKIGEALGLTPAGRQRLGIKGGAPSLTSYGDDGEPRETLEEYLARDPSPKLH